MTTKLHILAILWLLFSLFLTHNSQFGFGSLGQLCHVFLFQLSFSSLQFLYIQDVLQWRAQATPDHPLFLVLNAKVPHAVNNAASQTKNLHHTLILFMLN